MEDLMYFFKAIICSLIAMVSVIIGLISVCLWWNFWISIVLFIVFLGFTAGASYFFRKDKEYDKYIKDFYSER